MKIFAIRCRKFYCGIIAGLLFGPFVLHSAEQGQNNLNSSNVAKVNKRYSEFKTLSQILKDNDPEKYELIRQIYEDKELLSLEYQAPPPAGGNNLVVLNNDPSKVLYAAAQSSIGSQEWLTDTTGGTWTSTTPVNFSINPGPNVIQIPAGSNGRVYFSDQQIPGTPNPVSSNFIYDFIELTTGATWNTSNVDQVGIPLAFNYLGCIVGFRQYTREFTMAQIANSLSGTDFSNGVGTYRILGPTIPAGSWFPDASYLVEPINTGLAALVGKQAQSGAWTYTFNTWTPTANPPDPTNIGTLTVTSNVSDQFNMPLPATPVVPFTTQNVLSTAMTEGGEGISGDQARLSGIIQTMIDRGVVNNVSLWGNPGDTVIAYPWNYFPAGNNNKYAKALHDWSYNGMIYALSHDDIYTQSSSLTIPADSTVYLYLPKWTGTPSGNPQPNTWPNHNVALITSSPNNYTNLGVTIVNNGQWVIPNANDQIPSVGLPASFQIQFGNCRPENALQVNWSATSNKWVITQESKNLFNNPDGITVVNSIQINLPDGLLPVTP